MSIHRESGNTEGVEKFQVLSGKIQMMMNVFLQENPEMTNLIIDLEIGDPFTEIGITGARTISRHFISIEIIEKVVHNG